MKTKVPENVESTERKKIEQRVFDFMAGALEKVSMMPEFGADAAEILRAMALRLRLDPDERLYVGILPEQLKWGSEDEGELDPWDPPKSFVQIIQDYAEEYVDPITTLRMPHRRSIRRDSKNSARGAL